MPKFTSMKRRYVHVLHVFIMYLVNMQIDDYTYSFRVRILHVSVGMISLSMHGHKDTFFIQVAVLCCVIPVQNDPYMMILTYTCKYMHIEATYILTCSMYDAWMPMYM